MSNGLKDLEKLQPKSNVKSMNCRDFSFDFNYYDEEGNIKAELFSDIAENIVKKCFNVNDENPKTKKPIKNRPSVNQIRKFYDDLLNHYQIIENSNNKIEEFKKQLPYIKMMKAKANVAYQRLHINKNFKMFIEGNIDYIKDDMDKFNVFVTFFEAIVAYSKGVLKD